MRFLPIICAAVIGLAHYVAGTPIANAVPNPVAVPAPLKTDSSKPIPYNEYKLDLCRKKGFQDCSTYTLTSKDDFEGPCHNVKDISKDLQGHIMSLKLHNYAMCEFSSTPDCTHWGYWIPFIKGIMEDSDDLDKMAWGGNMIQSFWCRH